MDKFFEKCTGFDWDSGNSNKNFIKHNVTDNECEQVFFNEPIIYFRDVKHSSLEERFYLLGRTNLNRYLFVVFTIRENLIRIISARDMNRKERKIYNEKVKKNSEI